MTNYRLTAEQALMKELRYWRAERPDEWKMDEIIRLAEKALSAPAVQGEPVVEVVWPDVGGGRGGFRQLGHYSSPRLPFGTKLYATPQPAPDVSALVAALESLLDMQDEDCRYDHQGYCQNHNLDHVEDGCRVARAKAALSAHRKQQETSHDNQ